MPKDKLLRSQPASEQERLKVLRMHRILDTSPDVAFDRITALIARLFDMPIAVVSLVDKKRIWFKSSHGLPADVRQIEREPGFCSTAILGDEPYIVNDATTDSRACDNGLVKGGFGLRFYAGVPLRTKDNYKLGMLSVIDFKPRTLTDDQIEILKTLSAVVMDQIDLHLAAYRIHKLNSELAKANSALYFEASHDLMTNLLNRGAIMAQLDRVLELSRRQHKAMSLILADIDHFKAINDTYGHAVGDQVLAEVAKRIKKVARKSDGVGRIGGEEFMLVMYPCSLNEAKEAAERILYEINAEPFRVAGENVDIRLSISAGIYSTKNTPDIEAYQLFKSADDALYAAKNSGRNRVSVG